jgi:hypothetical protein
VTPGDIEPFEIDTGDVLQFKLATPKVAVIDRRQPVQISFVTQDVEQLEALKDRVASEVRSRLAGDCAVLWQLPPRLSCHEWDDGPAYLASCRLWLLRRPETAAICGADGVL